MLLNFFGRNLDFTKILEKENFLLMLESAQKCKTILCNC